MDKFIFVEEKYIEKWSYEIKIKILSFSTLETELPFSGYILSGYPFSVEMLTDDRTNQNSQ